MKYTDNFATLALSLLFLPGCFGEEWYEEYKLIGTVAENTTEAKRLVISHCYTRPEGLTKENLIIPADSIEGNIEDYEAGDKVRVITYSNTTEENVGRGSLKYEIEKIEEEEYFSADGCSL